MAIQRVPGERRSRFTEDLDERSPWPEYPRPTLRREGWQNLNGWWEAAVVPTADGRPDEFPERILVPFPMGSALSGLPRPLLPTERLWMRRRVSVAGLAEGGRLRLHFGAVDWDCTVWCDGIEVGDHRGGHDPWWLDVTGVLGREWDHELVLSVTDPSDSGPQPLGKQSLDPAFIWYPACAGPWQTIWLEPVPRASIDAVSTTTELHAGAVTVTTEVTGAVEAGTVHIVASGGAGDGMGDGQGTALAAASGPAGEPITLRFDRLRPWSPADPFLHDLTVELRSGGEVIDRVQSYFGARDIRVADIDGTQRVVLNGEPVFCIGLLDQGWWPDGLYSAPTDEALAFDIEAQKAMGFNTIRKHVKVEPARWYWHADRLGMLVWQDMPSTRVDRAAMGRVLAAGDELAEADWSVLAPAGDPPGFRAELDAMMRALAPHPSVVVWVPFNEGWGQHDTASTIDHVRATDPSRVVCGPSGWVDGGEGDLRDHHMYFREADFPGRDPDRAVVYGEFGGFTLEVVGHRTGGDTFGYGDTSDVADLVDRYSAVIDTIAALVDRGLAGAIYTQTTDVEGEINGLLTYDRAVQKIPNEVLIPLHRRLTHMGEG